MTLQTQHVALSTSQVELGELYASYKQLVLALAAGLIFEQDLVGVADHAARLRERCVRAVAVARPESAVGTATAGAVLAAEELVDAVHLMQRRRGDTDAGLERVRQRHRSLRRQVWAVLPFEYPSCASEHSHGGQHVHQDLDQPAGSSAT